MLSDNVIIRERRKLALHIRKSLFRCAPSNQRATVNAIRSCGLILFLFVVHTMKIFIDQVLLVKLQKACLPSSSSNTWTARRPPNLIVVIWSGHSITTSLDIRDNTALGFPHVSAGQGDLERCWLRNVTEYPRHWTEVALRSPIIHIAENEEMDFNRELPRSHLEIVVCSCVSIRV
jgi:hypothetical protein